MLTKDRTRRNTHDDIELQQQYSINRWVLAMHGRLTPKSVTKNPISFLQHILRVAEMKVISSRTADYETVMVAHKCMVTATH